MHLYAASKRLLALICSTRASARFCRAACSSYALPEENDLVCGEYILRFKVVEWVQQRTARREDVVLVG